MEKVMNTGKAILHLPPVAKSEGYKGHGGQELTPGVNLVEREYLDHALENATVAEWFRLGMIAPVSEDTAEPEELPPPPVRSAEVQS